MMSGGGRLWPVSDGRAGREWRDGRQTQFDPLQPLISTKTRRSTFDFAGPVTQRPPRPELLSTGMPRPSANGRATKALGGQPALGRAHPATFVATTSPPHPGTTLK